MSVLSTHNNSGISISTSSSLNHAMPNSGQSYTLVDTSAAVSQMVDDFSGLPTEKPSLYVDLEGDNLSRHGTISILQIYVSPRSHTYIIDVRTLGNLCFSSLGGSGKTLKDILECPDIPKVFFDVRNDSDALFFHFQINLAGIQDLQLMELASRVGSKKFVHGLSKCIEYDAPMTRDDILLWKRVKDQGFKLFAPESGGSYAVFNERPLPKDILSYCIQDVQYLPLLWDHYKKGLRRHGGRRCARLHETGLVSLRRPITLAKEDIWLSAPVDGISNASKFML